MANPGTATQKTKMEPLGLKLPSGELKNDARAYCDLADEIDNAVLDGKISPLEAARIQERVEKACERNAGIALEEAARDAIDPLLRFRGFLESSEKELLEIDAAVQRSEALTEQEKKRFTKLAAKAIELQRKARENPIAFMVYVGRDTDTGGIFEMARIHHDYFRTWTNKPAGKPNSLIMAPPKHAKSTCMRYLRPWKIGRNPSLRCLILTDEKSKAQKEVILLKKIMRHPRYRAVFPDVRVLSRSESGADTNERFAVSSRNSQNEFSREFTIEGAAYLSFINGNRYDWITPDDMVPPSAASQDSVRRDANRRWESVIQERLGLPDRSEIDMICTPWHEDDVSGRIQKLASQGRLSTWTIAIDQFRIKDDAKGRAIPIWDRYPSGYLEERKAILGQNYTLNYRLQAREDKQRAVRRLLYFNSQPDQCQNLEEQFPKQLQFDYALLVAIKSSKAERWLSIDPSATANRGSSDTGYIDAVLTPRGFGYVTDVGSEHLGAGAMQEWIVERIAQAIAECQAYEAILIEAQGGIKGMVSLWIENIKRLCRERAIAPIPKFLDPGVKYAGMHNSSKEGRLREASGPMESGLIRLAGTRFYNPAYGKSALGAISGSQMQMLTERILHFNSDGRTDVVDALSQFVLFNRDRLTGGAELETEAPEPEEISPRMKALRESFSALKSDGEDREEEKFLSNLARTGAMVA